MPRTRTDGVRLAGLLVGLVLLAALFAELGPDRILTLLLSLGGNFLFIVVLFGLHECVRALAVNYCFSSSHAPGFRRVLRVRLLGEAAGTLTRTGSLGAEPARAWMLAGQGGRSTDAYAAAVSELVANGAMSSVVSLAVTVFALATRQVHGELLFVVHLLLWSSVVYVAVAVWAVTRRAYVIGAIVRGLCTLPFIGRRLQVDPARIRQIEDGILHALSGRPATLVRVLCLETLAQMILIAEMYWTIRSMGVAIDVEAAFFVEVITKAANIVQFLGVTEAAYALVFTWLGMTAAIGFTLSLVKSLRSLAVAAFGLGLLFQMDRRKGTRAIASLARAR